MVVQMVEVTVHLRQVLQQIVAVAAEVAEMQEEEMVDLV
jgi:DNA-binding FrmR family transcriptional regulator